MHTSCACSRLVTGAAGWRTAAPTGSLVTRAVQFTACAVRQRHAASPLIKPTPLPNKGFTFGLILGLAFFAALAGLTFLICLFFHLVQHYSADKAPLARSPLAAASAPLPWPAARCLSGTAVRWSSSARPRRWPGRSGRDRPVIRRRRTGSWQRRQLTSPAGVVR